MTDIPGYRLVRRIGRGGMASVFLAEQESLGREVALKLLAPAQDADGSAAERFLREARIAASLHHPNIVPIHDFGVHEGTAYIAMAHEAGGTIAPLPGEKLAPRDALRLVRDVASALDYAHARGVVHRDIKPENILRREDGAAMLSDFGIARLIEGASVLTTEGTSVGTPHYMSPEQLRGEKVDGRSDLYSLGVVLWQLLTGELPYAGSDGWAIGTQHLTADIPRLPESLAHLQPLVDALLAKRPEGRLQSGAELVQRIDALLSAQVTPVTAPVLPSHPARRRREDSVPAPINRPPVPRSRVLAYVAVAMLVPLALVGWLLFGQDAPMPPAMATAVASGARVTAATAPAATAPVSIAVMPFEDLSPGRDQEYFSEGVAEELQSRLAQVPGLQVAGRASSRSFRGKSATVAEIGKTLAVGHVLEGTVRKDGDAMRVTVQLSNVGTGFQIWSSSYDRKLTDVFAVQDDIAGAVADALAVKLVDGGAATAPRHTPPFAAYDAYLQARQAMVRARPALDVALPSYRKAIALDPNYAGAWSGLAMAEAFLGQRGGPAAKGATARAMAAAERAVALDPGLGDAYAARGFLRAFAWDWTGALADVRRGAALSPRDGRNQLRLGYVLQALGRAGEARDALEAGIRGDPMLLPLWSRLAVAAVAQGDYPTARRALERVRQLDPEARNVDRLLASVDLFDGKAAQARRGFEAANDPVGVLMADYSLGKREEALRDLRALSASGAAEGQDITGACAWMRDLDCAFGRLEAAVAARGEESLRIAHDPFLAPLRSDPRYAALLARMGLPAPAPGTTRAPPAR